MKIRFWFIGILILFFQKSTFARKHSLKSISEIRSSTHNLELITLLNVINQRKRSIIAFVKDRYGDQFCIKQYRADNPKVHFRVVREVLASHVAVAAKIPVSRARVIPPCVAFRGKFLKGRPATLHTFVFGEPIKNVDMFPQNFQLKQCWEPYLTQRGLTRSIIQSMSVHPVLPAIVAFDTFVSNTDRGISNLFYDQKHNTFIGIDHEMSWRRPYDTNLSELAYANMCKLCKNGLLTLTNKELKALKLFNKKLKELIRANPPEKLCKLTDDLIAQIDFSKDKFSIEAYKFFDVEGYINKFKHRIFQQYDSAQKLVRLLDTLLT